MYVYSKKINLFLFYVDEGFSQSMSVNHVCMLPMETRGGWDLLRTGVTNNFELLCGFWEANLGPLRGLQVLLTWDRVSCSSVSQDHYGAEDNLPSSLPSAELFLYWKVVRNIVWKNNIIHGFWLFSICVLIIMYELSVYLNTTNKISVMKENSLASGILL